MTFVNEYISPEDVEKYHIKEIDKQFFKGHHKPSWTIDREHNIWLRYMTTGHEEFANHWTFSFFWKEKLMDAEFEVTGGGHRSGNGWRHYKLRRFVLSSALKPLEPEIIADLKEALIAFRDFGVRSLSTQCTVTFDF